MQTDELFEKGNPLHRQVRIVQGKRHIESGKAHAAFRAFAEMGESRSVRGVAEQLSKSRTLISRWKNYWAWAERVRLWDDALQEAEQAGMIRARRAMSERQARLASLAQNVVTTQLIKIQHELEAQDAKTLSPAVIARLFEISARIERLARGGGDPDQDQVAKISVTIAMQKGPRYETEIGDGDTRELLATCGELKALVDPMERKDES
jgi:hypothetical protein